MQAKYFSVLQYKAEEKLDRILNAHILALQPSFATGTAVHAMGNQLYSFVHRTTLILR